MLAHQGGWDEILLVVAPMIVIVLLLRLAKRRVDRLGSTGADDVARARDPEAARDAGSAPPTAPPAEPPPRRPS